MIFGMGGEREYVTPRTWCLMEPGLRSSAMLGLFTRSLVEMKPPSEFTERKGVCCVLCLRSPHWPPILHRGECRLSKMALSWNIAKSKMTQASSASMEEAKHRVLEFLRETCRELPKLMEIYNLDEVITMTHLRSKIVAQFRKHAGVTNPKVVDMLVFKGREELQNCTDHSKQRHHLISTYVIGSTGMVPLRQLGIVDHGESPFLKKFYQSNQPL